MFKGTSPHSLSCFNLIRFQHSFIRFYSENNFNNMAEKHHHASAKAQDFLAFVNASPTRRSLVMFTSIDRCSLFCSFSCRSFCCAEAPSRWLQRGQGARLLVIYLTTWRKVLLDTKRIIHCCVWYWQEMEGGKSNRHDRSTHRFALPSYQACQ